MRVGDATPISKAVWGMQGPPGNLDDDIRALIVDIDERRQRHLLTTPAAHLALGDLLRGVFDEWLGRDDDDELGWLLPQVRALEQQIASAREFYIDELGFDPHSDARILMIGTLQRIYEAINRSQTADEITREPFTRDPYQAADQGVGSPTMPSATTTANKVGTRLRKAREKAGLTKYELAKRSGATPSQIRQWEIGSHVPTPANVRRLIPHIGGTIGFYLFGDK